MAVLIKATPQADVQDIAFHDLELSHDCGSGRLTTNRNPVPNRYTLRCACGLEIELSGEAQKQITYTAIDEQARILNEHDLQAKQSRPVTVSTVRS